VLTDYYGVKLNHEIEYYDNGIGRLVAWINVTSLSDAVDTTLYMYYGNPSCSSQENPVGVWNAGYRMVQHLDETSGMHYDSTSYDNDGSESGSVSQDVMGQVDGCDDFDGVDDFVNVIDNNSLSSGSEICLSAWVNVDNYPTEGGTYKLAQIVGKWNQDDEDEYFLDINDGGKLVFAWHTTGSDTWGNPSYNLQVSSGGIGTDVWMYVAAVRDGSDVRFYIDGDLDSEFTGVIDSNLFRNGIAPVRIGAENSSIGRFFDGTVDEVRVSDVASSAGWIKTKYNNQISPPAFYDVGSEETSTQISWDVLLNFTGPSGATDALVFGEALDASDGQDGYDIPKPGTPPAPYVFAWFDANLSGPYSMLWKDYRLYPDTFKIWDLYVLWEDSGYGNITISWDPAILFGSEYSFVTLNDFDAGINTNMLLQNNYTYNASDGVVRYFQIICLVAPTEYHYSVPLGEEWNLVSLPVNQSVHKNNITVNYLGANYTWQQAVDNGTILGFIYGWNATDQNYVSTDVLDPGNGYWMYAYHGCDLWISSNISNNDDYIADLLEEWNLVGLPYNISVAKEDIIVLYNGLEYTWQQAVDNGTILGFIYGWNVTNQNYVSTDVLDPGEGYWMYAYYDCVLKREIV